MMNTKTERLTFAVTAEEADLIRAFATGEGLSVSEFLHAVVCGFLD